MGLVYRPSPGRPGLSTWRRDYLFGRVYLQDIRISRSDTDKLDTASDALGNLNTIAGAAYEYTIHNDGTDPLTVSAVATGTLSNVTSATVSGITLPAAVLPGASTTFTVTVDPAAVGALSFTLTATCDDPDAESTYTIAVSGTGIEQEIAVTDPSSAAIADGAAYASAGGTEGVAAIHTWTVSNTGTDTLTCSVAISGQSNCTATVTQALTATIAASGSDTYEVTVTPTAAGAWSYTTTVTSDDSNEAIHDNVASGTAAADAYEAAYFAAYDATGGHTVVAGATYAIPWDTEIVEDTPFTHTGSADSVTLAAGTYVALGRWCAANTNTAGLSSLRAAITVDGVELAGSEGYGHAGYDSYPGTARCGGVIVATGGEVVTLVGGPVDTASANEDVSTAALGSRLELLKAGAPRMAWRGSCSLNPIPVGSWGAIASITADTSAAATDAIVSSSAGTLTALCDSAGPVLISYRATCTQQTTGFTRAHVAARIKVNGTEVPGSYAPIYVEDHSSGDAGNNTLNTWAILPAGLTRGDTITVELSVIARKVAGGVVQSNTGHVLVVDFHPDRQASLFMATDEAGGITGTGQNYIPWDTVQYADAETFEITADDPEIYCLRDGLYLVLAWSATVGTGADNYQKLAVGARVAGNTANIDLGGGDNVGYVTNDAGDACSGPMAIHLMRLSEGDRIVAKSVCTNTGATTIAGASRIVVLGPPPEPSAAFDRQEYIEITDAHLSNWAVQDPDGVVTSFGYSAGTGWTLTANYNGAGGTNNDSAESPHLVFLLDDIVEEAAGPLNLGRVLVEMLVNLSAVPSDYAAWRPGPYVAIAAAASLTTATGIGVRTDASGLAGGVYITHGGSPGLAGTTGATRRRAAGAMHSTGGSAYSTLVVSTYDDDASAVWRGSAGVQDTVQQANRWFGALVHVGVMNEVSSPVAGSRTVTFRAFLRTQRLPFLNPGVTLHGVDHADGWTAFTHADLPDMTPEADPQGLFGSADTSAPPELRITYDDLGTTVTGPPNELDEGAIWYGAPPAGYPTGDVPLLIAHKPSAYAAGWGTRRVSLSLGQHDPTSGMGRAVGVNGVTTTTIGATVTSNTSSVVTTGATWATAADGVVGLIYPVGDASTRNLGVSMATRRLKEVLLANPAFVTLPASNSVPADVKIALSLNSETTGLSVTAGSEERGHWWWATIPGYSPTHASWPAVLP